MKKLLPIIIALITLNSCISLQFPDSINVDITIPEDADIEIMIDTLSVQAKDYDLTLEALIHKSKKKNKKNKKK